MNMKSKLVLSLGLLAAPLALPAGTPESDYVEQFRGRTGIPVPLSVVMPSVDRRFDGSHVTFRFVVDPTGTPVQIAPVSPGANAELVEAVTAAVAQWKFSPALVEGRPVARVVELPVIIQENPENAGRLASK
jgi:periplasmic protein TonB